ncbi:MAG: hypothetical protein P8Y97_16975, partial [Candidatus Lokiarchaeota archaeon]
SKNIDIKQLKGIVICKKSGEYLLDLILDTEIDPILLSSFVGALSLFGQNNLGKIEEIIIKGLEIEMITVTKHDLVLITIVDKSFPRENFREQSIKALDNFYILYKDEIQECIDISIFNSFKRILKMQIEDYFKDKENIDKKIQDFGFFTESIKKMRELGN